MDCFSIMILLLTMVIALAFYNIVTIDFPFTGPAATSPDALIKVNLQ
jgi:hypothetical protein